MYHQNFEIITTNTAIKIYANNGINDKITVKIKTYLYIYYIYLSIYLSFSLSLSLSIYIYILVSRTSCAHVHELPQSHCGDKREGTLF